MVETSRWQSDRPGPLHQLEAAVNLTRPVPRALLLGCIDITIHAPMGGNQERNRWLVVDDPELKTALPTFHLVHEQQVADLLGIPDTVTQVALLPVASYTGDTFRPTPRRPTAEITCFNRWKQTIG